MADNMDYIEKILDGLRVADSEDIDILTKALCRLELGEVSSLSVYIGNAIKQRDQEKEYYKTKGRYFRDMLFDYDMEALKKSFDQFLEVDRSITDKRKLICEETGGHDFVSTGFYSGGKLQQVCWKCGKEKERDDEPFSQDFSCEDIGHDFVGSGDYGGTEAGKLCLRCGIDIGDLENEESGPLSVDPVDIDEAFADQEGYDVVWIEPWPATLNNGLSSHSKITLRMSVGDAIRYQRQRAFARGKGKINSGAAEARELFFGFYSDKLGQSRKEE
jgi:hypothetical protein